MVQAIGFTAKHYPGCQNALQTTEQETPSDPLLKHWKLQAEFCFSGIYMQTLSLPTVFFLILRNSNSLEMQVICNNAQIWQCPNQACHASHLCGVLYRDASCHLLLPSETDHPKH